MQIDTPDTTTQNPTPFKCPVITIPEDATESDYSTPQFTIQTAEGLITVVTHWCHDRFLCHGSVDALVAAGLIAPEWLPGLPGNHPTCQSITFDDNGPRLYFATGRRPGKTITIEFVTADRVKVKVPLTKEQKIWVQAKEDEWIAVESEEKNPASIEPDFCPLTARGYFRGCFSHLKKQIYKEFDEHCCKYDQDSMGRIEILFDLLKDAFEKGRVIPKYHTTSNVIMFPQISR